MRGDGKNCGKRSEGTLFSWLEKRICAVSVQERDVARGEKNNL